MNNSAAPAQPLATTLDRSLAIADCECGTMVWQEQRESSWRVRDYDVITIAEDGGFTLEWARRSVAGMLVIVMLLAAPLLLQGMEKSRIGQNRPYSYPVSVPVREAVQNIVAQQPTMETLFIARSGIEPGAYITIVLSTADPTPEGFRRELRNVVRQKLGLVLRDFRKLLREGVRDASVDLPALALQQGLIGAVANQRVLE